MPVAIVPVVMSTVLGGAAGAGSFDAVDVGGGADFRVKPRAGLRVEFRNHIRSDTRGSVQYWARRGGIVFR